MLEINTNVLIWTIINFVVLLAALSKVMWRPLLKMLESREKEVAANLSGAEEARRAADQLRQEFAEQVSVAETRAREIITRATSEAETARLETMGKAQSDADQFITKARDAIAHEKRRALDELRDEVAGLAVAAAARVVGKVITPEDHKRLINDAVREAGKKH
jgi:F-type H+-transporting ATPase subunit b